MLTLFRETDLQNAAQVFYKVFSVKPFSYEFLTIEKAEVYLNDLYRTPGFMGFRYYDKAGDLGYCLGQKSSYFSYPYFEIKEIFVDTDKQRKGIGSEFLGKIEKYLKSTEVYTVTLCTAKTIPAHDYYLKNGYRPCDDFVQFSKSLISAD